MPDHAAPACLATPYSSMLYVRGGTIIAEDVTDLATHRRCLLDPDTYRPANCVHCGRPPRAHDFRARRLRADPETCSELIRRYRCRPCRAVWQVLPAVIARYLHRTWRVVQSSMVAVGVLAPTGAERRVSVPASTTNRWSWRLALSAIVLTQALFGVAPELVRAVAMDSTRSELVDRLASVEAVCPERKMAQLAGWIHRVMAGMRLM